MPVRYLCEHYDQSRRLLPQDEGQRIKVREWIHATEGTFIVRWLPTIYVRQVDTSTAEKLGPSLAGYVVRDLGWLEGGLKKGSGRLSCEHVSAVDTIVALSVQCIFWLRLALQNRKWVAMEVWLRNVEAGEMYKRALAKTGHHL